MKLGNRKIGTAEKCFIIAEAGVNHNGDLEKALQMIDMAADAGVDAVKFQTFQAELLASEEAPKACYQEQNTGNPESQFQMLKRLELPKDAYPELISACRVKDLIFMSTPFDEGSVDLLEEVGIAAYKIPSGEITNVPLLKYIAQKNKPVIMSTGMAKMEEIRLAVQVMQKEETGPLALLQCTSNYPVKPEDVNLRAMNLLAHEFGLPVGFSDHSLGIELSVAAVAMGACIIEKHFTLDKTLEGPDHLMSLELQELKDLVLAIRNVEQALGDGQKGQMASEKNTAEVARKSIHYKTDLSRGTILTEGDFIMLRPGTGVSPLKMAEIIGKKLKKDVPANSMLDLNDVE